MTSVLHFAAGKSKVFYAGLPGPSINLASKPFRQERAQNAALILVLAMSVILLAALSGVAAFRFSHAQQVRRQMALDSARLGLLQLDQRRYSELLARSQNTDVFSWSVFYNQIIARRSISWSRVFDDLASVLPDHMRLVGIRSPQVSTEGAGTNHVQLDLVVASDQPEALIIFLKHLQESDLFGSAKVMSRIPPAQNDPEYKFRVLVAYAQRF